MSLSVFFILSFIFLSWSIRFVLYSVYTGIYTKNDSSVHMMDGTWTDWLRSFKLLYEQQNTLKTKYQPKSCVNLTYLLVCNGAVDFFHSLLRSIYLSNIHACACSNCVICFGENKQSKQNKKKRLWRENDGKYDLVNVFF